MAEALTHQWNRFLDGLTPEGPLPSIIVDSWRRSESAGVNRDDIELAFHRVADREIARRLAANADWLEIARPHLEWLTTTFADIRHVVYVTDREGIVLHAVGDKTLREAFGLAPGYDWSESRMGTNGAGTALAANRPVAVIGSQHYQSAFADCTCMGAPIHAADGTLLGAIDISTSLADGSPERLSIIAHAAYAIGREAAYARQEADLRQAQQSLRESESQLRAILDNTTAVIYLMDSQDRFLHINRRWEQLFGMTNDQLVGKSLDEFFPQSTADKFREHNRQVRQARRPIEFEEIVPQADGMHTYLSVKVPICDAAGEPIAICGISTDFTDRKRAEQEREQAFSIVNDLVASAPVGIALLDDAMRFRLVNRPLAEMNGISADDHVGKSVAEVVPDLLPQVERLFAQVMESGKPVSDLVLEGETLKAPGVNRAWREAWFPIAGPGARPAGVGVIVQEVTEQRDAEEKLRASEAQFRQLADAMPQIVWVARPDGYHEYFNQRWYDYIGCSQQQCEGHGWSGALHPGDRQRAIDRWNLALRSGQPYEIEYRFRGQDGGYRWFLGRALPVHDAAGQIVRWFGTCTDIEDMKRAEQALRESEARYRSTEERLTAALVASDTGTFRWDPVSGSFMDFDDHLKRLFGLCPDDAVVSTEELLARVHPDDRPALRSAIDDCHEGADFEMEFRVVLADGSVRWLYDRAKMIRNAENRTACLVGACIDITQRKQIEVALQQADRRKDEFLATLAHELRNPLAPIRTGLELLRIAGSDHQLVDKVRVTMERQMTQLVRLVDDLLDIARIRSGKVALRKERVSLASVIRSAVDATRPMMEDANHELTVTLPQHPIVLEADAARLAQVVSNLLTNAARYTPAPGKICLTAECQESEVVVTVQDTGIGIPADLQGRIFEMFAQVDRKPQRAQSGLGIGLSLVKRLVEMHGGSVSVVSEAAGKGSAFTVRLPLADGSGPAAATVEATPTQAIAPQTPPRRVLIVDDNAAAADLLASVVMALGSEVRTAADGLEAIEAAASFRPDVVLMDLDMPRMDGYDAARALRQQAGGEELTIVALTGWGQDDDRRRSQEAGFDHHFLKPVELDVLRQLLSDAAVAH
jgi:PAS domain S-box-containing protein